MNDLINELMDVLQPVLKSKRRAQQLLEKHWADQIALLWTTENVHRAANEKETVLTETEARELLSQMLENYNPQYGLRWSDVTDLIKDSGKGRDMTKRELRRLLHKNVLTIEPRQKGGK